MDRSWIKTPRKSHNYRAGVKSFIEFARARAVRGLIVCPCLNCCNGNKWLTIDLCHRHLLENGFLPGYTTWTHHGEQRVISAFDTPCVREPMQSSSTHETPIGEDDIRGLLQDALGLNSLNVGNEEARASEVNREIGEDSDHMQANSPSPQYSSAPTIDEVRYQKLLNECDQELYPGCKYSNLSFNLHLYHLKCLGGMSNKVFTMLLEFLNDVFPHLTSLPSSAYEAKKLTNDLGLGYQKIHACPNDCMLYWGEKENQQSCHICHKSRWQTREDIGETHDTNNEEGENLGFSKKLKAAKVLRYFPLIPRLKRLYMCSKTGKDMRWHESDRTKDGKLRHPADGLAWKAFDDRYSLFSSDPRNIRLGLASDGFNPFRTMSTTYSTWPVLLVPYNFPPWICMKQYSFILSMIIPGEKGPGNDIDVYLQPLINDLKQLWEGVDAYDAFSQEHFKLRAALMWTINDFPAYANLSGWSTKGRVACPSCTDSTHSIWLKHGKKFCYMGHRRWLEESHPYRFEKERFDGTIESNGPPTPLSGSNILQQLIGTSFEYGKSAKSTKKRAREELNTSTSNVLVEELVAEYVGVFEEADDFIEEDVDGNQQLWKKRSIFFDLPYWEYNLLRHNLDVMHIEKNVCDNLLGTLLNLEGKTKDNEKARRDLMEMGLRHDLHLIERTNKKPYSPPAYYTMSNVEKFSFLQVLKDLKVPDGYASNISRGVNLKDRKITNLKSHDGHILMQDILPIALRASLHSNAQSRVVKVVSNLCSFFKGLCSKVLDLDELDKLQHDVVRTLCELELLFPPSFFTIMVHLIIHLIEEAKIGGPVHYRWMYPIERYLAKLKSYVRNKAQPEGSIAEGYIANECNIFCSRYFEGVETSFNRLARNHDDIPNKEKYILDSGGRSLGKIEHIVLDQMSLSQAHRYVLLNHDKIKPYRDRFLVEQQAHRHRRINLRIEEQLLVEQFPWWLHSQVSAMEKNNCDEEVIALALGPRTYVKKYQALIINGFKFHTRSREKYRRTQNSGVVIEVEGKHYYGRVTDIIELDYFSKCRVILFRCDWVDIRQSRGLKKDKFGFPLVNFYRPLIHSGQVLKDDPFIISSQPQQVFYVEDQRDKEWSHVIVTKPRDLYDMGSSQEGDDESYTECMPSNAPLFDNTSEALRWSRSDIGEEDI